MASTKDQYYAAWGGISHHRPSGNNIQPNRDLENAILASLRGHSNGQQTKDWQSLGQQQLILLVLSLVIVGLAIVVGIRAFQENATRANADVLVQDVIEIAVDAIVWKVSPAQFGGQKDGACKANPSCFQGLNFHKLGYGEKGNPFRYEGPDGTFRIVERKDALGVKACNTKNGNKFIVEFRGIDRDSIVLVTSAIGTDYNCTD